MIHDAHWNAKDPSVFPAVATKIFANRKSQGSDGARFNLGTAPFQHAPVNAVSFLKASGCTYVTPLLDELEAIKNGAPADAGNVMIALLRQLNRNGAMARSIAALNHQAHGPLSEVKYKAPTTMFTMCVLDI